MGSSPASPVESQAEKPKPGQGFFKGGVKGRTDGLGRLLPIRNKPGRRAESCSRGRKSTDKREGAAREAVLFSSLTAQKHYRYSALQLNLKHFSRSDARARCKRVACDHPAFHASPMHDTLREPMLRIMARIDVLCLEDPCGGSQRWIDDLPREGILIGRDREQNPCAAGVYR